MFDLPLSDACLSEVLARVSYRYIEMRYARAGFLGGGPPRLLQSVYDELDELQLVSLAMWVAAYRRVWAPLYSLTMAKENFLIDARRGYSMRRVVFPQYKSNRSDPRVTNRGVAREDFAGETEL